MPLLPEVGAQLPEVNLVGTDLSEVTNKDFAGKRLVISLFPSVVTDENHKVIYTELVPEVTTEPNYDAAIETLS